MREQSAEARIALHLAIPFIAGVIQGPMPASTENLEALGAYADIAEQLLNAYALDGLHPGALRKWAELEPEVKAKAPKLWRPVQARLNGHASVNGTGQADNPLVLTKLANLLAEPEEAVDCLVGGYRTGIISRTPTGRGGARAAEGGDSAGPADLERA